MHKSSGWIFLLNSSNSYWTNDCKPNSVENSIYSEMINYHWIFFWSFPIDTYLFWKWNTSFSTSPNWHKEFFFVNLSLAQTGWTICSSVLCHNGSQRSLHCSTSVTGNILSIPRGHKATNGFQSHRTSNLWLGGAIFAYLNFQYW